MTTTTLYALHEHIRRVMALNYQHPLWITAEIAQIGRSRGHFYLELVEKGAGGDLVAQGQAVLWAMDYRRIQATLGNHADEVLREGLQVRLQVRVDFHERYGLKLQIADLDPAHTFGQLELERRQTVQILQQAGLLDQNRSLSLPQVMQRVAVVTSGDAAGFQDFREHLEQNNFGYRFHCQLFATAVQGKNAIVGVREALAKVTTKQADFDCIVILRGGGARLDLSAFDDRELCKSVALMPLPVLVGIGHETDETVLDLVAHTSLKTPTAVADFLLQHHLLFENDLFRCAEQLRVLSGFRLKLSALELERGESDLLWGCRERIKSAARQLDGYEAQIPLIAQQRLSKQEQFLTQAELLCAALHRRRRGR